jgi:hypothetical protein
MFYADNRNQMICPIMSNNRIQPCLKEKCMGWQPFICRFDFDKEKCEYALCGYNKKEGVCGKPEGCCKLIDKEGI